MLPPVHLVVGYLSYSLYSRWRYGRPPVARLAAVAVLASAVPDLLDRPLYWLSITPVGRTVGHSLLFALPLIALVWLVARRRGRPRSGVAFAIGYLSHLASDVPWHLLSEEYHELGFLLWPVTHMPPYTGTTTLGAVAGIEVTTLWLEALVVGCGLALWVADGAPGAEPVLARLDARRG
ncbi:MAG: metal-dependent hydrolase [Halalkalicoccus sp.]